MTPRVLFVLHVPPPVHGASMVGLRIRESEAVQAAFESRYVNLSTSGSIEEIGKIGFRKLRTFVSLMRTLRREIRTFRPDLVYVTPSVVLPGFLKDWWLVQSVKRAGCPVAVHLHNKGALRWKDRGWASRLYRQFFSGTRVILLSWRLYADIEPYVSRDQVLVCPNGIPSVPVRERAFREVPRLLFLSNLIPSKGVEVLLEACRLLREQGVAFSCVFAGAPSAAFTEDDFRKALIDRDLEHVVSFVGKKTGAEKDRLFAEADLFVFPTYYPLECFPLVVLEAMSAGLPVVTTPEGAIPDMIRDGESGILCPKQDAPALARALRRLIEDPSLRHRMGEEARKDYEARFTLARFERTFISVLEQALTSGPREAGC